MLKSTKENLANLIQQRGDEGLLRSLTDKSDLVDFCSNDYLGFARSNELWAGVIDDLSHVNIPFGATGSRLISGNNQHYENLESFVAAYHKGEAGLLFNSGYDANLGLLSSVPQSNDLVLFDELVHASIRDGLKLSRARVISFKHNDLLDLESKLFDDYNNIYVVVESVYSMNGDFAPLLELVTLVNQKDIKLIVDEAHATGIFGPKGEGRVVELGLGNSCFARVHTFGKALGCNGAIVIGSNLLKSFLINFARSFIYTTALPLVSIFAIKRAYDNLSISMDKVFYVRELCRLFEEKIKVDAARLILGASPIQGVLIKGNNYCRNAAIELEKSGFYAKAILYPTVARGEERIRICFHAFNTKSEVEGLAETFNRLTI